MDMQAPPGTGRRSRQKREMRERILDAAIACFVSAGYDGTTMEAIGDRADVARATVFNHYPNKEDLLRAYLERRREQLVALLESETEKQMATATLLHDAFALLAAANEQNPAEARELVRAWWRTGGGTASEPDAARIFARVVAAGQQQGDVRADIDCELTGRLLLDAYAGVLLRWVAADEAPFPLAKAMRDVCSVIVDGLHPAVRGQGRREASQRT